MRNRIEFHHLLTITAFAILGVGCSETKLTIYALKDGSGTLEVSSHATGNPMAAFAGGEDAEKMKAEMKRVRLSREMWEQQAAQYGRNLKLLSVGELEPKKGWDGVKAVYSFDSITDLKIINPLEFSVEAELELSEVEDGKNEFVGEVKGDAFTFGFKPGPNPEITINIPEAMRTFPKGKEGPGAARQQAMMQQMMKGFAYRLVLSVDGEITKTNASYAGANKADGKVVNVGLVNIDMDRYMANGKAGQEKLEIFAALEDPAARKQAIRAVAGVDIEMEPVVTVSFE